MAARTLGLTADQLDRLAACPLAKYLHTVIVAEKNGGWLPPHLVVVRREAVRLLADSDVPQAVLAGLGDTSRPRVSQLYGNVKRTTGPDQSGPDRTEAEPDRTAPDRTEPPADLHDRRSHCDTPLCTEPIRTGPAYRPAT